MPHPNRPTTAVSPLSYEEQRFLGLVREATMQDFVGQAGYLSDDQLRMLFSLARVALEKGGAGRSNEGIVPSRLDRATGGVSRSETRSPLGSHGRRAGIPPTD